MDSCLFFYFGPPPKIDAILFPIEPGLCSRATNLFGDRLPFRVVMPTPTVNGCIVIYSPYPQV